MPYTLWSKGRLLGESRLAFETSFATSKMGWFYPTDVGERLMSMITAVGRTTRDLSTFINNRPDLGTGKQLEANLAHTPEQADVHEAELHHESLELELRAPDGSVVATEYISITDTEELLAWDSGHEHRYDDVELDPETEAEIEELVAEFKEREKSLDPNSDWNREPFGRYQIYIALIEPQTWS